MSGGRLALSLPLTQDPVAGLFGPQSRMWRINREALLLGAGPAALLLQLAHPLVAEAVAAHSGFEADPFARLRRTLDTTMGIVFGDRASAEACLDHLNGIHAGVNGPVRDPDARAVTDAASYSALDPDLLLWVQATLAVTSVRAYRRWAGPLSDAELEAHWQEQRALGEQLGIPRSTSPVSYGDLVAWFEGQLEPGGPVHVTPTARRLSVSVLRPGMRYVPHAAMGLAFLPGLTLLPARLRSEYGIAWSPWREGLARALSLGIRAWVAVVPRAWHTMPQARAADRRVAGHRARRAHARPSTTSATIVRIPE